MVDTLFLESGSVKQSFPCSPFRKRDDGKRKDEKKFRKYLEDILKSFYLCIRFPEKKADIKEAIFEEIYINNTSSTRARLVSEKETVLGKIKRTVNIDIDRFGILEQIINWIVGKRYYYNEELDPGSG